jgi:hypothetical protein
VAGFREGDIRSGCFPGRRCPTATSTFFRVHQPRPPARRAAPLSSVGWCAALSPPDFGLMDRHPPSALVIAGGHAHRAHWPGRIGLDRRRSRNWRMAEEITARLRLTGPP